MFQVPSPFFLFGIDWELTGVRTLWVRVANLALKPDCEYLTFLNLFVLFSKTKKAGRNMFFLSFLRFSALFQISKKNRRDLFFSGFFQDIFQNNNRICSIRQCDLLTGSVMWQLPYAYVTVVVSSSVVASSTCCNGFEAGIEFNNMS